MKKLLKSGICGFVNSVQMHCSQLTWSNNAVEKKKKKKKLNWKTQHCISATFSASVSCFKLCCLKFNSNMTRGYCVT